MATNITAITDSVNQDQGSGLAHSFRGLFDEVRPFTATLTDASLAAQVAGQCDIVVAGAALGDVVLLAGPAVDTTGMIFYASVTAASTVTITSFNVESTDANTTLSAGATISGFVLRPNAGKLAGLA
jgi:hypothetical protein